MSGKAIIAFTVKVTPIPSNILMFGTKNNAQQNALEISDFNMQKDINPAANANTLAEDVLFPKTTRQKTIASEIHSL